LDRKKVGEWKAKGRTSVLGLKASSKEEKVRRLILLIIKKECAGLIEDRAGKLLQLSESHKPVKEGAPNRQT